MTIIDWVKGDHSSLLIPTHAQALREGGVDFLNKAFHNSGFLSTNNQITKIIQLEECFGGSTGQKLLLSLEYAFPEAQLHTKLFVKFSRDFNDSIRDRAKNQLAPEVKLALLSQMKGFPIAVPSCAFADYHEASGSGILITERIAFAQGNIEPLYEKCLDYTLPQPLEHYCAIITALGRLAGTQKSGSLSEGIAKHFPFIPEQQAINQPIRYSPEQLQRRLSRISEFAARYPKLLAENIRQADFFKQCSLDIPQLLLREKAIKKYLNENTDFIALIHWNANIDNAWFWRDKESTLQCGLMDWGSVSQMNVAMALWGALSAAELSLWNDHLDELLALFASEYQKAGGPQLAPAELKFQMCLAVAMLGLAWLMDAPAMILAEIPQLNAETDRFDPLFEQHESARTQLQMLNTFLNLWQSQDFASFLNRFIAD